MWLSAHRSYDRTTVGEAHLVEEFEVAASVEAQVAFAAGLEVGAVAVTVELVQSRRGCARGAVSTIVG
jgi:hypothetical protein